MPASHDGNDDDVDDGDDDDDGGDDDLSSSLDCRGLLARVFRAFRVSVEMLKCFQEPSTSLNIMVMMIMTVDDKDQGASNWKLEF